MQSSCEGQSLLRTKSHAEAWIAFFKINCDALFQTALLLSADPDDAEASVMSAIDSVDVCRPPDANELAILQERIAREGLQAARPLASPEVARARLVLQDGLRPVLQIEPCSRVCFVLRVLLGYATSSCAQMLGIEEVAVRTLLRIAIFQLHDAVIGNDLPQGLNDPPPT